jgi:hypothetical protein
MTEAMAEKFVGFFERVVLEGLGISLYVKRQTSLGSAW